ncbi:MAG TPA: STAS domain-containing protein [Pseudonocardiaceae bacterium]|nr:STAS domain-containing protein [Pseudonocardiaceae bacterium]
MELSKYMRDGVTVVSLEGDLDSHSAPEAHSDLAELLPGAGSMLLDLHRLRYMSSAGLRMLLLTYRRARDENVRMALAAIPDEINALMAATGFLDAFTVTSTVSEGVRELAT